MQTTRVMTLAQGQGHTTAQFVAIFYLWHNMCEEIYMFYMENNRFFMENNHPVVPLSLFDTHVEVAIVYIGTGSQKLLITVLQCFKSLPP